MNVAERIKLMLAEKVIISENDFVHFITDATAFIDVNEVIADMIYSGFVSIITVNGNKFFALGTSRLQIFRDGNSPVSMGF